MKIKRMGRAVQEVTFGNGARLLLVNGEVVAGYIPNTGYARSDLDHGEAATRAIRLWIDECHMWTAPSNIEQWARNY